MSEWIPVSDPPYVDGPVLVWFQGEVGILHYWEKRWLWGDETDMDIETVKRITHWMPLPAPPKAPEGLKDE